MGSDLQDIFRLAARHFYRQYKKNGGSQAEIAEKLGVSKSYVSAVINGSRTSSMELQNQIANLLYGPFDEFLAVGRRIQNGLDPMIKQVPEPEEGVEKLIARLTHYVMDHQRIEKELADTKNFYKDIVQSLQSGVFVTDKEDTIFFTNQLMFDIVGLPRKKLIGINCLYPQNEFFGQGETEFSKKYLETQKSLKPLFYKNIRVAMLSGRRAYLSGWMIPNVYKGVYNGMTCTIRDTTMDQELPMLLKITLDNNPYALGISKKKVEPGRNEPTYFTNKKMRELFAQEDAEYSKMTIRESLDRCEESIVNKKEWRDFLEKHSTAETKGSLLIKHTNGKQYRWSSENLLDNDGKPWGRMATVKEVGQGRRTGDQ